MSNVSALPSCIEEDNAFFKHMLDLIPPDLYFDSDIKKKIRGIKGESDFDKLEGENQTKLNCKRLSDPLKCKTVSKIQEELNDEESPILTKLKEKKKNKKKNKKNRKEIKSAQDNLEVLQEKLKARIQELQAKRNLNTDEKQEKKRLRRKQSKVKLKIRLKVEKQKKNQNVKGGNNVEGTSKDSSIFPGKRPIYNKEGKLVFSKFDFSDSDVKEKSQSGLTGRDYKRLLEKIEKRNQRINKLKEKDTSAAKNMEEKLQWQAAIYRAEGEKVKDNPELLKKALKRKEKMKEKRKKKWDERVQQTEQRMDAKQHKRQQNIKSKKQAKIEKKIKKAKKRGRIIPGF